MIFATVGVPRRTRGRQHTLNEQRRGIGLEKTITCIVDPLKGVSLWDKGRERDKVSRWDGKST